MEITTYVPPDFRYRPFDPDTVKVFNKIKEFLKDLDIQLHHVGSTAFGAGGKNIIDILGVHQVGRLDEVMAGLRDLGFQDERDKPKDRTTYLMLGATEFNNKTFSIHIHLASPDMVVTKRMPYFVDYMRLHPDLVQEYDNLKKEAQEKGINDNAAYNANKAKIIHQVLATRESDV